MNHSQTILSCPECGAEIPLSETLTRQLEAQVATKFEAERSRADAVLTKREAALAEREAAQAEQVEARVKARVGELEVKLSAEARERARKELLDLEARLSEERAKREASEAAELTLRKKQRELEQAQEAWELERARQLDADRTAIREEEAARAAEASKRQIAELELKLKHSAELAETMKRRAEQGSVQLQGETLEQELACLLRQAFAQDEIEEVKKGSRGGDCIQHVRPLGSVTCGRILWEAKRAQNWGADWIGKAKRDAQEAGAEVAVIVSEVLPRGVTRFGQVDGVWVTEPEYAAGLAHVLRSLLIAVANQRSAVEGRSTKAEALWDYVTGPNFKARVEAALAAYTDLVKDHLTEKRTTQLRWARRERAHERLLHQLCGIAGDVQGLGGKEVPEIEEPEVLELGPGDSEEEVA